MKNLKRFIPFICLIVLHSTSAQSQVTVLSATVTTPPATECTNTWYTVASTLANDNYGTSPTTVNVVGFAITISVNFWTGIIPSPGTTPFSEDINLGVLSAGTYSVTSNGYIDGNLSSSLPTVLIVGICCNAVPSFTVISQTACVGDTLFLTNTSTGVVNQSWYDNNILFSSSVDAWEVLTTTGSHVINLVVTDGVCVDSTDLTIDVFALPIVDLGMDTTICIGDSLLLDATITNASYVWQDFSSDSTLMVYGSGIYGVFVQDENGCEASDDITIDTMNCDPASLENIGLNLEFMLYPNPTNGVVHLKGIPNKVEYTVSVINLAGKLLVQKKNKSIIDLSSLDAGTYIVQINCGVKKEVQLLIIE